VVTAALVGSRAEPPGSGLRAPGCAGRRHKTREGQAHALQGTPWACPAPAAQELPTARQAREFAPPRWPGCRVGRARASRLAWLVSQVRQARRAREVLRARRARREVLRLPAATRRPPGWSPPGWLPEHREGGLRARERGSACRRGVLLLSARTAAPCTRRLGARRLANISCRGWERRPGCPG